ncbi:uncharacterized protein [Notamacropus eugenii]|uniref:uncharacterized protein isoform X2 n=1 Tax=Notamacropus eugenii TaxID=9315 RepID=UPI003B66E517
MFSLSFWTSVLLTVLNIWASDGTQNVSIEQPSSPVTATIGGSALLPCRSKTDLPAGPLKWYKGSGPIREVIFSDRRLYSRVQKVNNTNRILDICISNITSQDEGVYYCIKFKKSPEMELASGGGTHLIVAQRQSSSTVLIAATVGSISLILILSVLCCYFKRWKGPILHLASSDAAMKNKPQREDSRFHNKNSVTVTNHRTAEGTNPGRILHPEATEYWSEGDFCSGETCKPLAGGPSRRGLGARAGRGEQPYRGSDTVGKRSSGHAGPPTHRGTCKPLAKGPSRCRHGAQPGPVAATAAAARRDKVLRGLRRRDLQQLHDPPPTGD